MSSTTIPPAPPDTLLEDAIGMFAAGLAELAEHISFRVESDNGDVVIRLPGLRIVDHEDGSWSLQPAQADGPSLPAQSQTAAAA